MNPDPIREQEIFLAALERAPEKRTAFVEAACHGDENLLRRVRLLLEYADDSSDALQTGLDSITISALAAPLREGPGTTIGPYKLLQKIGEGGCGTVFMAEQEEPIRRRVALKVIKLGMDTKAVIARFDAEREALSLMDHPNIARVLDAGTTDSGRPFFAMELVKGIPITRYCNEHHMETNDRIDLFIKVCAAVQHAHQKGIIHRDLKPSNILVTLHDGVPVPKVIDFGIAKATRGKLTDQTLFTAFEQFIGTPAYMSPEQAALGGLDIDTRSDVYSLGVLLYELLTGKTPFDSRAMMAAGIDSIRRTIQEAEPARPSTRLSTLQGDAMMLTAKERGQPIEKLIHRVRGDLDWIVMKCLEKDRTRRYETANGLAADLKRHLENEPVMARPPSAAYKVQKAFRRNRGMFAAIGAVMLASFVGLGISVWQAYVANLARKDAESARSTAELNARRAMDAEAVQARLRESSEQQAKLARRSAYNSDMQLARQSMAVSDIGRARLLLDAYVPKPGETDLREWEWRYIKGQILPDAYKTLYFDSPKTQMPRTIRFRRNSSWIIVADSFGLSARDLTSNETLWFVPGAGNPILNSDGSKVYFSTLEKYERGKGEFLLFEMNLMTLEKREVCRLPTTPHRDLFRGGIGSEIQWIGLSPDDKTLLVLNYVVGNDPWPRQLRAYDRVSGSLKWSHNMDPVHRLLTMPASLSADGQYWAGINEEHHQVVIVRVSDGQEVARHPITEEYITALAFSPDSSEFLVGTGYVDGSIRVYNRANGKLTASLNGHRTWVSSLKFDAAGKRLVSGSADQTIRVWSWPDKKPVRTLRGHSDEIHEIELSPDGKKVLSRSKDGSILLWSLEQQLQAYGNQILPFKVADIRSAAVSSDGKSIVGYNAEAGAFVWDVASQSVSRHLFPASTNFQFVSLANDGEWITVREKGQPNPTRILHVPSGIVTTGRIRQKYIGWVNLLPGGKFLVGRWPSAHHRDKRPEDPDEPGALELWDVKSQELIHRRDSQGMSIGYYANGACRYACTVNATNDGVEVLNLRNADPFNTGHRLNIFLPDLELNRWDFSSDLKKVVAVYDEGWIAFWDLPGDQPKFSARRFMLGAHGVCFLPGDKRVAATSNGEEAVKIFDAENFQEVLSLSGVGSLLHTILPSPDGRFLLAITDRGVVQTWTAPTFGEIETLDSTEKASRVRDTEDLARCYETLLRLFLQHPQKASRENFVEIRRSYASVLKRLGREADVLSVEFPVYRITDPEDLMGMMKLVTYQVLHGKTAEYDALRRSLLKSVDLKSHDFIVERTTKLLSIGPNQDEGLRRQLLEFGKHSAEVLRTTPEKHWGLLAYGMAQYRCDRIADAQATLTEALEAAAGKGEEPISIATAYLAMSLARGGDLQKANQLLSQREQAAKFEVPLTEKDPEKVYQGMPATDALVAWLSLREARELISTLGKGR